MVNKLLRIFHRRIGNLHEAAYLLATFALFSQILAIFRDRILAHKFGAGTELDIYYAAFRVPDLIYVSIASFVAVTILIPFLLQKLEGSKKDVERFIGTVFTVFLLSIILICILAFLLMPYLAYLVAPGFDESETATLVLLSRILLLSPILLGLSNLLGSITQLYKKFFVFALGPVLYNIGIIGGLIFLQPFFGLTGVVFGVIIGAFFHMLIQLPTVFGSGIRMNRIFSFSTKKIGQSFVSKDIRRVIFQSFPRTISLSITQFVMFILISVASLLGTGAIAVFTLAHNLQSVPLAIIGMSYSVAAFPTLASHFRDGDWEKFKSHIVSATRHILFWSFPFMILFVVLRAQIVRVLYGTGAFDWSDTRLVAAGLALFSLSISAQCVTLLYARGYYATGNTRRPLLVNAGSAFLIITLTFVFLGLYQNSLLFRTFFEDLLRVSPLSGTAILMLPLAFSIGMIVNAVMLIYFFQKDFSVSFSGLRKSIRESVFSSIFMGSVAYILLGLLDDFFELDTFWGIFFQGAISGGCAIAGGIALLWILDNEEIKVVSRTLHRRFWKTKPIHVGEQDLLD